MVEQIKPRTFTIIGQTQRNACFNYIDSLHADNGDISVTVQMADESRRSQQNRLMWLWNGQIGQQMGVSPDYAHGLCKLDVLLPMALADESLHKRASFVHEVLSHVIKRSHKIAVAYDMLRSKDLSVKQFAAYLTAADRHFAAQGIVLVSPEDLRAEALFENVKVAA